MQKDYIQNGYGAIDPVLVFDLYGFRRRKNANMKSGCPWNLQAWYVRIEMNGLKKFEAEHNKMKFSVKQVFDILRPPSRVQHGSRDPGIRNDEIA